MYLRRRRRKLNRKSSRSKTILWTKSDLMKTQHYQRLIRANWPEAVALADTRRLMDSHPKYGY